MDNLKPLPHGRIGREWLFVQSDLLDGIAPNLSAFLSSWIIGGSRTQDLSIKLFWCLACSLLFIYVFCVSSQIFSVDEDRINKPFRPLPAGLVTPSAMWQRIFLSNLFFLVIAWHLDFVSYATLWAIISIAYHHALSKHWFPKNIIFMGVGTWIMVQMQWKIANGPLPMAFNTQEIFAIASIWSGVLFLLADVRDQDGDLASKRKTLPLDIGDHAARKALVFLFVAIGPALYLAAFRAKGTIIPTTLSVALFCSLILFHWFLAFRTWKYRDVSRDKNTYKAFAILFCMTIVALPNI